MSKEKSFSSLERDLREYILAHYGSISSLAKEIGVTPSTLYTMFQKGIGNSSVSIVIDICTLLDISLDALAQGSIISQHKTEVSKSLFNSFHQLSTQDQEHLLSYLDFLLHKS